MTTETLPRLALTCARADGAFVPTGPRVTARLGETLAFRFADDAEHDVAWSGATPTRTTLHSSTAVAHVTRPGRHVVRLDVLDLDGRVLTSLSTRIDVRPSQNRHDRTGVRTDAPHASL